MSEDELEKIIVTWAYGISEQKLLLGGQKSNGFGKCTVERIEKTEFHFKSCEDLDHYIFRRKEKKGNLLDWKSKDYYSYNEKGIHTFSMPGKFPYGVYQAFEHNNTSLTGLQKNKGYYFLPSTSLKGLLRNEITLLLKKVMGNKHTQDATQKCEELFGGEEQRGKLILSDIKIENGKLVEIDRCFKQIQAARSSDKKIEEKQIEKAPAYIKIDRLTGGEYNGSLRHQQEIQGEAIINFTLFTDNKVLSDNPYIFPIVYALRRIGTGLVPLGGRTVIGLGQFFASHIIVQDDRNSFVIETTDLSEESKLWLKMHYESFKRWCSNDESNSI